MFIATPAKHSLPVIDVDQLADFIRFAPAGAQCIYHVGNLAGAREFSQRADLAAVMAAQAETARRVFLTQRRRAPGTFEYLIQKRWPSCPRRG